MPVIQPYYDPSFDAGAPAAVTFWTMFVGTRSRINQERMEERLRQADPTRFQDDIDEINRSISELIELKAKAGRDALQGLYRLSSDYTRGEMQRRKAEIDAQARTAAAIAGLVGDIEQISSEERRYYAEVSAFGDDVLRGLRGAIESAFVSSNATAAAEGTIRDAIAKAAADSGATDDSLRMQFLQTYAQEIVLDVGLESNHPNKSAIVAEFSGTGDPAAERDRLGAMLVEQDTNARMNRALSSVPSPGGMGASDSEALYDALVDQTVDARDLTLAEYDELIALQRQRLEAAQDRQNRARQQSEQILAGESLYRNPMLAPVYYRRSPLQDFADRLATISQQPGGADQLELASVGLAGAGGDPEAVDLADRQGPRRPFSHMNYSQDSGQYLFVYLHNQLAAAAANSDDAPAAIQAHRDIFDFVDALPEDVKRKNLYFFNMLDSVRTGLESGDPADALAFIKGTGQGAALNQVALNQAQRDDIHFSQMVSDTLHQATSREFDNAQSVGMISDIAEFARTAGPEFTGPLGEAIVNSYDRRVSAEDGRGLFADAKAIGDVADTMFDALPEEGLPQRMNRVEQGLQSAETLQDFIDLLPPEMQNDFNSSRIRDLDDNEARAEYVRELNRQGYTFNQRISPALREGTQYEAAARELGTEPPLPERPISGGETATVGQRDTSALINRPAEPVEYPPGAFGDVDLGDDLSAETILVSARLADLQRQLNAAAPGSREAQYLQTLIADIETPAQREPSAIRYYTVPEPAEEPEPAAEPEEDYISQALLQTAQTDRQKVEDLRLLLQIYKASSADQSFINKLESMLAKAEKALSGNEDAFNADLGTSTTSLEEQAGSSPAYLSSTAE